MDDDVDLARLQRTFKERTAIVQALAGDLARAQRAVSPQTLLAQRIEYLVEVLFPVYVTDEKSGPPTNPERITLELGWLERLEAIYRQGLRESIVNPRPIIIPGGRSNGA